MTEQTGSPTVLTPVEHMSYQEQCAYYVLGLWGTIERTPGHVALMQKIMDETFGEDNYPHPPTELDTLVDILHKKFDECVTHVPTDGETAV